MEAKVNEEAEQLKEQDQEQEEDEVGEDNGEEQQRPLSRRDPKERGNNYAGILASFL